MRCLILLALLFSAAAQAQLWVGTQARAGSVAVDGATVIAAPDADPLEAFVAADLADDLRKLGLRTGRRGGLQIWVGTVGRHPQIDAAGLDLSKLKNCWECFQIGLLPGARPTLVIAGADRRGTAYGVYTLSQALGVSPWHWWADVAPLKRGPLYLALDAPLHEGPAVRYRGLFINDEDWGLFPWAARTFEPEAGTIGPKTYEQVFRLLLRLKANTLWPAMHKVSGAFNANPENARLAQRYGILMGSSHAEPLLRNNVAEWKAPAADYDYSRNAEGVRAYWAERLRSNGGYDNLYTLGMRGIHDSAMQGAATTADKQALLSRLIADQRELLARHVGDPRTLPQFFVPYKEVLELLPGVDLPDDITLVWPDDNFGYLRQLPDAAQRRRSGGHGVYYHLSYLGAPLSYLWLSTTPPALVAEEMGRAFAAGAERLWVVNAGDIKPAELNLSHWFDLAWNPRAVREQGQPAYLRELGGRLFGPQHAEALGAIWDGYYRLNFERRPEHLQYHLPGERLKRSGMSAAQQQQRLRAFAALLAQLDALRPRLSPVQQAGFFQLVEYPLRASALAHARFIALERYAATMERDPAAATRLAARALRADARLKALTGRYNAGRWAGMLAEEPADNLWTGYRLQAPLLPAAALASSDAQRLTREALQRLGAAAADVELDEAPARGDEPPQLQLEPGPGWQRVPGLGRGEGVLRAQQAGATLNLSSELAQGGDWCLRLHLLPSFPTDRSGAWRLRLQVHEETEPIPLSLARGLQTDAAWAQGVLANRISTTLTLPARSAGPLRLRLRAEQADLLFDGAELQAGACR